MLGGGLGSSVVRWFVTRKTRARLAHITRLFSFPRRGRRGQLLRDRPGRGGREYPQRSRAGSTCLCPLSGLEKVVLGGMFPVSQSRSNRVHVGDTAGASKQSGARAAGVSPATAPAVSARRADRGPRAPRGQLCCSWSPRRGRPAAHALWTPRGLVALALRWNQAASVPGCRALRLCSRPLFTAMSPAGTPRLFLQKHLLRHLTAGRAPTSPGAPRGLLRACGSACAAARPPAPPPASLSLGKRGPHTGCQPSASPEALPVALIQSSLGA